MTKQKQAQQLPIILILALALTACGTVTSKTNVSNRASFDRQDTVKATSGVLDYWKNEKGEIIGRKVSEHFKERADALTDMYGDQFDPTLKRGEGYTAITFEGKPAWGVDRERYTKALQMFQFKRNGRQPTTGVKKLLNKIL